MSLFKSSVVEDEQIACVSQVDNEEQVINSLSDSELLSLDWNLVEGWMEQPQYSQYLPYSDFAVIVKQMAFNGAVSGYTVIINNPELFGLFFAGVMARFLWFYGIENLDSEKVALAQVMAQSFFEYEHRRLYFQGFFHYYVKVNSLWIQWGYQFIKNSTGDLSSVEQAALIGCVFFTCIFFYCGVKYVFRITNEYKEDGALPFGLQDIF